MVRVYVHRPLPYLVATSRIFASSSDHINPCHGLCLGLVLVLCHRLGQQLLLVLVLVLLLLLLLGLCPYPCPCHGLHQQPLVLQQVLLLLLLGLCPCLCHGLHQQPLVLQQVLLLLLLLLLLLQLQHPHQQPLQPITVLSANATIDETILVCRSLPVFAGIDSMPFLLAHLSALTQKSNLRCPWSPPEQKPTVRQARPHEWMHVEQLRVARIVPV
jgi:hypothetical protein